MKTRDKTKIYRAIKSYLINNIFRFSLSFTLFFRLFGSLLLHSLLENITAGTLKPKKNSRPIIRLHDNILSLVSAESNGTMALSSFTPFQTIHDVRSFFSLFILNSLLVFIAIFREAENYYIAARSHSIAQAPGRPARRREVDNHLHTSSLIFYYTVFAASSSSIRSFSKVYLHLLNK